MNANRLEHLNVTLTDLDRATRALQAIVPDWAVRGAGTWDDGSGHAHEWRHVGDDFQYLSLYETPPGQALRRCSVLPPMWSSGMSSARSRASAASRSSTTSARWLNAERGPEASSGVPGGAA